jgi:hypothetical protein
MGILSANRLTTAATAAHLDILRRRHRAYLDMAATARARAGKDPQWHQPAESVWCLDRAADTRALITWAKTRAV